MSTVRYSDTELWKVTKTELDSIKTSYTFQEFSLWAIERLGLLVKLSTEQDGWMDPEVKHLRNYRMKAQNFYREKLV